MLVPLLPIYLSFFPYTDVVDGCKKDYKTSTWAKTDDTVLFQMCDFSFHFYIFLLLFLHFFFCTLVHIFLQHQFYLWHNLHASCFKFCFPFFYLVIFIFFNIHMDSTSMTLYDHRILIDVVAVMLLYQMLQEIFFFWWPKRHLLFFSLSISVTMWK